MIESMSNIWTTMRAVNLFPEVIILSLGAYFIAKDKIGLEPKYAPLVPAILALIGQLAFSWPKDTQDVFMDATMGLVNMILAIGLYSFSDKYGLLDKLGARAGKVIEGGENAKIPAA